MPEIHVVNGEPRECSDAITARGLTAEWLADPVATEAKIATILAAEAVARTTDAATNQIVLPPDTVSGPTPSRRTRPAPASVPEPPTAEE